MKHEIVLIAHNLRSSHNVGSLLRTAEGLGVDKVFLSGYTPYPSSAGDSRLPHIALKTNKQIHKTALGAEDSVTWVHEDDVNKLITDLKQSDYKVIALEQTPYSRSLPDFVPAHKTAILVGREVEGVEESVLAQCDGAIQIPMFGDKESFNVTQAAAMALYHCKLNT